MNCIDIDSSQHELYDSWRKLYTVSFPIFEQRTQEQQEKAFSCADYHLVGYSEGDMFVGFISYWEFGSYRYIEHFAVHQGLRNFKRSSIAFGRISKISHTRRAISASLIATCDLP